MKKLGVLLILAFVLCSLGSKPVSAQTETYGYIPLLAADYDQSLPRQLQSKEAFKHLLPLLIDARAQGIIADFTPDFYGGFVSVTNPASMMLDEAGLFAIHTEMRDVIVPPSSGEGQMNLDAAAFHVDAEIYSTCFSIHNGGANAYIKGKLTDQTGVVKGFTEFLTDASGYAWDCWDFAGLALPGYTMSFNTYNSSGAYLRTYKMVVPRTLFNSFDKTTGLVRGSSLAGKTYEAHFYHRLFDENNSLLDITRTGTVRSDGKWSVNFDMAMRGGDIVTFKVNPNTYFTFTHSFESPSWYCLIGRHYCYYGGLPKKPVEMTITHAGHVYEFSGTTDRFGYFEAGLENSYGDPINLAPTDKITATGASSGTLPNLTMIPNRDTDRIKGVAPASSYVEVRFRIRGSESWYSDWVKTDSSGKYNADFRWTDIPATDSFISYVYYTKKSTGNTTFYRSIFID